MAQPALKSIPLCVDLDGTVIRTDLLFESLVMLLKQRPWLALMLPVWLLRGKAFLKRRIAERVSLDPKLLPYHEEFLEWLRVQEAEGRELILVTAADENLARPVASYLGLKRVIASDGIQNLQGTQKLAEIRKVVSGDFDYAGNSWPDLKIWRMCSGAIIVGGSNALVRRLRLATPNVTAFGTRGSVLKEYVRALRIHHWAKNVLIYIPIITAHQMMHPGLLLKSTLGALLFSLCSSAQYLLNDLLDLESDRRHPVKKLRPFASGRVPLVGGLLLAPAMLALALGLATLISKVLAGALAMYFLISLTYSVYLKQVLLLDVFTLSSLYTFRILVGHLMTGIPFSAWLFSFAFFLFLSLGFSKRTTELVAMNGSRRSVAGRGYHADDLLQVNLFGVCSAFLSVVVFMLYLQSIRVRELYRHPQVLWLLSPILLYWLTRVWILASRGQISEDPLLFVLRDRVTYMIGSIAAVVMMVATIDSNAVRAFWK